MITEEQVNKMVSMAYVAEGPAVVLHLLAQCCEHDEPLAVMPEMKAMLADWAKALKVLRDKMDADMRKICPDTSIN